MLFALMCFAQVNAKSDNPIGYVDGCWGGEFTLGIRGWAVQNHTHWYNPYDWGESRYYNVHVHVYVYRDAACNDLYTACDIGEANLSSPDVADYLDADGNAGNCRFSWSLNVSPGTYYLVAYAITNWDEANSTKLSHSYDSGNVGVVTVTGHYAVGYDANGGTGEPTSQTKTYGVNMTLSSEVPTREGYTFLWWTTSADGNGSCYAPGDTYSTNAKATLYAQWQANTVNLTETADNTATIEANKGVNRVVSLADRTLWADGRWNTLCLPFDVPDFKGTPLANATVMTLASTSMRAGTLVMNFQTATDVKAGTPCLVRWDGIQADLTIRSTADWNTFVNNVNNGTNYAGKVVRLADDITVTTMVGNESRTFNGTFDGCGHTVTVNMSGSGQGTALFYSLFGATIQNLHVKGTVRSSGYRPASIASFVAGNTTIRNCWSEVAITSTLANSWIDAGAIVARLSSGGVLTLTDCIFTGSITFSATSRAGGGMIGWSQVQSAANVTNCLYMPSAINISQDDDGAGNQSYYFVRGYARERHTLTNCYYNAVANASILQKEGTDASAMTQEELLAALGHRWQLCEGNLVPSLLADYADNIDSPTFADVVLDGALAESEADVAGFIGGYAPVAIGNGMVLFDADTLASEVLPACHAWFNIPSDVRLVAMNFDDGTSAGYFMADQKFIDCVLLSDVAQEPMSQCVGDVSHVALDGRTIDNEWNTLALPFDVTEEQLNEAFGEGWALYGLSASTLENRVLGLEFTSATSIEAGKAYLFRVSDEVGSVTGPVFHDVTIDALANTTVETDYVDFVPTLGVTRIFGYNGSADEPGSIWSVLVLGAGNTLYNPASLENAWMKGFRGYFQVHDKDGNADESLAAHFRMSFDARADDVTGIIQVKSEESRNKSCDAIYNLMGQKVESASQNQMQIVRGKKVIISKY